MSADFPDEPTSSNKCHMYFLHNNGSMFYRPNISFHEADRGAAGDREDGDEFCGDSRLTLIYFPDLSAALGLAQLPESQAKTYSALTYDMPIFFKQRLANMCSYCARKGDAVWREINRSDEHFDSYFRCFDTPEAQQRCFLEIYTLKVPLAAELQVNFLMVYHIKAQGGEFIAPTPTHAEESNRESIFAFIAGLKTPHIRQLLSQLVDPLWRDKQVGRLDTGFGITPRLVAAAVLVQCGDISSSIIADTLLTLQRCDKQLVLGNSESPEHEVDIRAVNHTLLSLNRRLTAATPMIDFVVESSDILGNQITRFDQFVSARLDEWEENPHRSTLKDTCSSLDIFRHHVRDNERILKVRLGFRKDKASMRNLQKRIDINLSLFSNMAAERDRAIQLRIARNTQIDGSSMVVTAILSALFLPMTFTAVLLTTPMFNWTNPDAPTIVPLPFGVYWGASIFLTIMVIIFIFPLQPKLVLGIVDMAPKKMRKHLQRTKLYRGALEKTDAKQEESSR